MLAATQAATASAIKKPESTQHLHPQPILNFPQTAQFAEKKKSTASQFLPMRSSASIQAAAGRKKDAVKEKTCTAALAGSVQLRDTLYILL